MCVKHAGEVLVCAARATRQNRRFVALTLTCVVPRRGPPRGAEGHHVLLCRRRLARAPRRAVESGKLGRHRLWQSVHIRLGDGLHEMNRVPGPRTVRAIDDQQRKRIRRIMRQPFTHGTPRLLYKEPDPHFMWRRYCLRASEWISRASLSQLPVPCWQCGCLSCYEHGIWPALPAPRKVFIVRGHLLDQFRCLLVSNAVYHVSAGHRQQIVILRRIGSDAGICACMCARKCLFVHFRRVVSSTAQLSGPRSK